MKVQSRLTILNNNDNIYIQPNDGQTIIQTALNGDPVISSKNLTRTGVHFNLRTFSRDISDNENKIAVNNAKIVEIERRLNGFEYVYVFLGDNIANGDSLIPFTDFKLGDILEIYCQIGEFPTGARYTSFLITIE